MYNCLGFLIESITLTPKLTKSLNWRFFLLFVFLMWRIIITFAQQNPKSDEKNSFDVCYRPVVYIAVGTDKANDAAGMYRLCPAEQYHPETGQVATEVGSRGRQPVEGRPAAFSQCVDQPSDAARLNNNGKTINENYYGLDGRKLTKQPTKKGVYVRGGKKIVIK